MKSDLNFYQVRLVRRELCLLAIYRNQGRRPRMLQGAYWRASSLPLAIGLAFFVGRFFGLSDPQAALAATILFSGLLLADLHMFFSNAPAWIFARKTLDWDKVSQLHQQFLGTSLDLSKPLVKSRLDDVEVPQAYLAGIAGMYQGLVKKRISPTEMLIGLPEMRVLGLMTLLTIVAFMASPHLRGFILCVYFFLAAWNAKRIKAALDFHLTWPVLRHAFNWDKIRRLS